MENDFEFGNDLPFAGTVYADKASDKKKKKKKQNADHTGKKR